MTSSLLFSAVTIGFGVGTILLERIIKFLGRFYLSLDHKTYLPAVPFFHPLFTTNVSAAFPCGVGYSPAKARFSLLVLGGLLHPLFFIIMGTARNYPSLLLAYGMSALARSFWTASRCDIFQSLISCSNFYVVSTPKKPLGVLLGCWCFGSFLAPLVCQTLMAKGIPWRHFYLGSLVVSAMALSSIIFAFRPTRNEDFSARHIDVTFAPNSMVTVVATLLLALSMPYQWAFSLFAFIYSGSETTFQGFIVTYLLAKRHSNPDTVGYVSSGFWGGMAAGRILWGYYCVALSMTILIWLLSSAVMGLMYGPMFPGTLGLCNDVLPRDVHMVSMAILNAVASAGSALLPLLTGLLSNIDGMRVFCYVTVSQTAAMCLLWLFFPSSPPVRVSSPA
ncbi:major facilitator superfamily domain-containing protein [Suillus paluster]|uniref:major facilitator superfamily domain-containing protein n=1 Tax=Suillus paluster TaxID=48578 RepID=UPI001B85B6E4|nr:major facilitator superfamily domain-containing protein [Suillus paluster]KAG1749720.1 major facilitator superfamily domain-containing protein [Suillus paluster]